jgi:hypothetical protein
MAESASATIAATQLGPSSYQYTITLDDTGSTTIGTFWFAWIASPFEDFLASRPTGVTPPPGWTDQITHTSGSTDGYGILWTAPSSSSYLQQGKSLTFSFTSSEPPSSVFGNSPFYPGTPELTSFVYSGAPEADPGFQFLVTPASPPPAFTAPANGSTDTTTTEPVISGTGVAGDIVTLSIDSTVVSSSIVVAGNGIWTFTPTAPLANGSHTLSATQAASGGPSSTAATDTFTVNVPTAPPAPAFTAPANGSTDTTTTEPVISGTGVAGDIVTLSIDSTVLSSSIAVDGNGNWTFTPTAPLANGSHTLSATQAASGGPSSTAATDTFTVNVPTAPPAPAFTAPANGGADTTTTEPVISGTGVAGDIVTLRIGPTVLSSSIVVAGDGSWTFTPTAPLANGNYTLSATQAASGGPSSTAAADTFTVNVPNAPQGTAPPPPAFTAPANGSTDTTTPEPVISGTGIAGDVVTLSIGSTVLSSSIVVAADGSWTFTPTAPLANGNYTLTATQTSGGPNSTAATDTFAVNLATNFSVLDTTTNTSFQSNGTPYSGPVAGLQSDFIYTGSDNLDVTANVPNVFIHTGSGEDAINVSRSNGNNVLDGSTNSNFYVGGTGDDTFFVDDRGASADIWSTVSNFHAGDAATIFGITQSGFDTSWVDGQGATGYTGLTLHVTASGHPTASLTLAGFSTTDLSNGRISTSFGTEADGTPYLYVHANS